MRFFFMPSWVTTAFMAPLDAAHIKRSISQPGMLESSFSTGKEKAWMLVQ